MTPHGSSQALQPPLQWDIFCRVIDNFGDIGVCWRFVTQLAALGHTVRLWADDASALAWMAPTGCSGVELRAWASAPPTPQERACDVMVEAFGCEINPEFIAYSAYQASASGQKPVWINLEYLSAESYVERNHRLPSLIASGPAAGWTRWFFYPGFTAATGGLLRESSLMATRKSFHRHAWRAAHCAAYGQQPPDPKQRWVSLFCYEPIALPELLAQCQAQPTQLLVTPGRPQAAVQAALAINSEQNSLQRLFDKHEQLSISYLP
ncbi:MAG: elongation factor P maturation arginine rhamnosyltransferase EarP, partial [Burkholderiaceae bacterium]|nr:elongation factor P maturation arginine rhamnosyltransferase EarP [Burkholderiaceae bacterium]